MSSRLTCRRGHAEERQGCPSCYLWFNRQSYRDAVCELRGTDAPKLDRPEPPRTGQSRLTIPPAAKGPRGTGWWLTETFTRLGAPSCQQCRDDAAEMDQNGPAWCKEHLQELADRIRARIDQYGWWTKAKVRSAATKGVLFGDLPASLEGIILQAIERAEQSATEFNLGGPA